MVRCMPRQQRTYLPIILLRRCHALIVLNQAIRDEARLREEFLGHSLVVKGLWRTSQGCYQTFERDSAMPLATNFVMVSSDRVKCNYKVRYPWWTSYSGMVIAVLG